MTLRATVLLVAALNLTYFVIEFYLGHVLNSLSLISDSVDFLEDAFVNLLIAVALAWSAATRKYVSYFLAVLLVMPGLVFIYNAIMQLSRPETPEGSGMVLVGLGALVVNVFCALLIARHKNDEGGLFLAAFYASRNDAITNVLIIGSGIVTLFVPNIWPDLAVGTIILILNSGAARRVIKASRHEGV